MKVRTRRRKSRAAFPSMGHSSSKMSLSSRILSSRLPIPSVQQSLTRRNSLSNSVRSRVMAGPAFSDATSLRRPARRKAGPLDRIGGVISRSRGHRIARRARVPLGGAAPSAPCVSAAGSGSRSPARCAPGGGRGIGDRVTQGGLVGDIGTDCPSRRCCSLERTVGGAGMAEIVQRIFGKAAVNAPGLDRPGDTAPGGADRSMNNGRSVRTVRIWWTDPGMLSPRRRLSSDRAEGTSHGWRRSARSSPLCEVDCPDSRHCSACCRSCAGSACGR